MKTLSIEKLMHVSLILMVFVSCTQKTKEVETKSIDDKKCVPLYRSQG